MTRSRRLPDRSSAGSVCAAIVATVVLTWPLLSRRGYPLARDLVFTPDQPLRPESLGISSSAPRAVPLDAVVAVLDTVVGGELLARVAVAGGLLAVGLAAGRATSSLSTPARLFCVVFSVWNPFVVERLALGQWALLLGYAGVWGVVALALGGAEQRSGRSVGPWLALGALTATGALLVGGAALLLFRRAQDRWHVRSLVALAQLPWLVPALFGGGRSISDPAGVDAFAARAERGGGALWTLIGLGGIWDRLSAPTSRAGWLGHVTSATVLVVLLIIVLSLWRARRPLPSGWTALGLLGGLGLALASLSSCAWGASFVELLTANVPGAGLLRDSQKWLAWFVVPVVLSAAWVIHRGLSWVAGRASFLSAAAITLAVLLPVALLPDATRVVWRTLAPVAYPPDFEEVAAVVAGEESTMTTLPWRAYREFAWGNPVATYDPASRWFDVAVVGSDQLTVGRTVLQGEDATSRRVGVVLARDVSEWASGLSALGVGHVLVYRDDPMAPRTIPGAERAFSGEALTLWRLGARPTLHQADRSSVAWMVGGLDLCVALVLLLGAAGTTRAVRSRFEARPLLPFSSS